MVLQFADYLTIISQFRYKRINKSMTHFNSDCTNYYNFIVSIVLIEL